MNWIVLYRKKLTLIRVKYFPIEIFSNWLIINIRKSNSNNNWATYTDDIFSILNISADK